MTIKDYAEGLERKEVNASANLLKDRESFAGDSVLDAINFAFVYHCGI
jgi:hypothetical protein